MGYKVSYVDPSLEDYLSPAFYLTPPLDAYDENAIYINGSDRFAGADLFTTLAHEGYRDICIKMCTTAARIIRCFLTP